MSMPPSINKLERATKGPAKTHRLVSHHWKAAASLWPIKREGGNDSIPSDLQGPLKARDIRRTVTILGKEVERCSIMPNVVSPQRLPGCSVRDNPMNLCSTVTKACFGGFKCSLG